MSQRGQLQGSLSLSKKISNVPHGVIWGPRRKKNKKEKTKKKKNYKSGERQRPKRLVRSDSAETNNGNVDWKRKGRDCRAKISWQEKKKKKKEIEKKKEKSCVTWRGTNLNIISSHTLIDPTICIPFTPSLTIHAHPSFPTPRQKQSCRSQSIFFTLSRVSRSWDGFFFYLD
jgi:hypothetical protein